MIEKKMNDALCLLDPNYVSIVHIAKKIEWSAYLHLKMIERERKKTDLHMLVQIDL